MERFSRRRQKIHPSASGQSTNRSKRQRKDDPPLELLPRLFDRMKKRSLVSRLAYGGHI
jgi:hypothetical protein